ncbi:hypothetical protein [Streptomyces gobiensis]|uniref:hypothetical protein n=1 Tax=Streptomyces gobiensis TaxID=2875706 RepID=UPI001E4B7397|nr:hypothetical protein [Streptomyces gobiensis]UGY92805.1 hypothetical protein test1122_14515 [Streptomyces gobiensis]
MSSATNRVGCWVWRVCAALCVAVAAVAVVAAPVAQADGPVTCKVGAYVMDTYDFSPAGGSFRADLWVWSLCPDEGHDPLEVMEFTNANKVEKSLHATTPVDEGVWGYMKVVGSFRVDWDTRAFPFDRHRLVIAMEPTDDISDSRYVADKENTTYDLDAIPEEWQIVSFRIVKSRHTYRTTFGDPALKPEKGSTYDRLELQMDIARAEYNSFIKLTGPVYVASMITLVIFVLVLDSAEVMLGRLSLLGAVLFAIVVNMQQSSTTIGAETALTLTDKIHILGLVFTIIMLGITIITWTTSGGSDRNPSRERRRVIIAAVMYVLSNLAVILPAAISG